MFCLVFFCFFLCFYRKSTSKARFSKIKERKNFKEKHLRKKQKKTQKAPSWSQLPGPSQDPGNPGSRPRDSDFFFGIAYVCIAGRIGNGTIGKLRWGNRRCCQFPTPVLDSGDSKILDSRLDLHEHSKNLPLSYYSFISNKQTYIDTYIHTYIAR